MENSIEKSGFFCLMMMMIDGSFAGFSKKKKSHRGRFVHSMGSSFFCICCVSSFFVLWDFNAGIFFFLLHALLLGI